MAVKNQRKDLDGKNYTINDIMKLDEKVKGKRILVAMSGGVDSSVAAVMLHKMGADVVGVTMKTWNHDSPETIGKSSGCCNVEDFNDARQIAVRHGFKHFIVDIRKDFDDWVIDRFVDDYMSGITPNPCVLCNTHIKDKALMRRANDLGCDYIATGHYANVREEDGRFILSRGLDPSKDQSYALWGVSQEFLSRTILPLGSFHKTEIREMAEEWGLTNVADKPDSYEICFIPDNDYHRFLKDTGKIEEDLSGGKVINAKGEEIGIHSGFPFYTIGQRKGLHITDSENGPYYVLDINPKDNILTVGSKADLISYDCVVKDINMVKYSEIPEEGLDVLSKIRYNDDGAASTITPIGDGRVRGHFPVGRSAITPGQALVSYEGDDVVMGGWIEKVNVEFE